MLHAVFSPLVAAAADEGADLLKWGGDAVLLLLEGRDHPLRAARAARAMHRVLGRVGHLRTSVGRVVLRASSGVHSGPVHLVLAGDPAVHRELIVVGPAASAVCRADSAAGAGEIVVTDATAALLPPQRGGYAGTRRSLPGRQRGLVPRRTPRGVPGPAGGAGPAGHPAAAAAAYPPHPARERARAPDGRRGVPPLRRHRPAARGAGSGRAGRRRGRAGAQRAGLGHPARGRLPRVRRRRRRRQADAAGRCPAQHRRRRGPPGLGRAARRRAGRRDPAPGRDRPRPRVHR